MSAQFNLSRWSNRAVDPPRLTDQQWSVVGLAGVVLLVMAICQFINFNSFADILFSFGLTSPNIWAAVIIVAELWGAASFFKIRLSEPFRMVSGFLAFLVSGFWFIMSIKLVSQGASNLSSGYFGKYLTQHPGWWTVIEVTIFFIWVLYSLQLTRTSLFLRWRD